LPSDNWVRRYCLIFVFGVAFAGSFELLIETLICAPRMNEIDLLLCHSAPLCIWPKGELWTEPQE
jgi:hypothetical protein